MRHSTIAVCIFITVSLTAGAISPPNPKPLPERVRMASHIFIGTAKEVSVIDKKGKKVSPEPKGVDVLAGQGIEILVEVDEALRPLDWKPNGPVNIWLGGGFFAPEQFREGIGKKFIYITTKGESPSSPSYEIYGPSYGWNLTESLDRKAEIEDLIKSPPK